MLLPSNNAHGSLTARDLICCPTLLLLRTPVRPPTTLLFPSDHSCANRQMVNLGIGEIRVACIGFVSFGQRGATLQTPHNWRHPFLVVIFHYDLHGWEMNMLAFCSSGRKRLQVRPPGRARRLTRLLPVRYPLSATSCHLLILPVMIRCDIEPTYHQSTLSATSATETLASFMVHAVPSHRCLPPPPLTLRRILRAHVGPFLAPPRPNLSV